MISLGYRTDCNGKSVFFTGDHEPWYNLHAARPPVEVLLPREGLDVDPASRRPAHNDLSILSG